MCSLLKVQQHKTYLKVGILVLLAKENRVRENKRMENVHGNKKGKESPKSMEQVDTKR